MMLTPGLLKKSAKTLWEYTSNFIMNNFGQKFSSPTLTPPAIEPIVNPLIQAAAEDDDEESVTSLLQKQENHLFAHERNNVVLEWAIRKNHQPIIQTLLGIPNVRESVHRQGNAIVRLAAYLGHFNIVDQLLGLEKVSRNAHQSNNYLLRWAAAHNAINTVNKLLSLDKVMENSHIGDNEVLRCLAISGHTETIRKLLSLKKIRENAHARDNEALRGATANGCTNCVLELLKLEHVKALAHGNDNEAFRSAVENGNTDVTLELLKLKSVRRNAHTKNNVALCMAAELDQPDIALALLKLEEVRMNAHANRNVSLIRATRKGHTQVVRELLELEKVRRGVTSMDLSLALLHDSLDIAHEFLNIEKVQKVVHINHNFILRRAVDKGYIDFALELLKIKNVQDMAHAKNNYVLRKACRKGYIEPVSELLKFERVCKNAHANDNEAYQLALQKNHIDIVALLVELSSVQAYERLHRQFEAGTLGDLAQYNENAMRELTTQQSAGVQLLVKRYVSHLSSTESINETLKAFKKYLANQYLKNPVRIKGKNYPLDKFSKNFSSDVFKEYYRHSIHRAYCYLSSPNLWMSPKAKHVRRNKKKEGSAILLEKDKLTLAAIWLTVNDKDFPLPQDFTLETIKEFFISQIALIARSHNYDNATKKKVMIDGIQLEGDEYMDDMEGDKPSCAGGVEQRLAQILEVLFSDFAPAYRPLSARIMQEYFASQMIVNKENSLFSRIEAMPLQPLSSLKQALNNLITLEEHSEQQAKALQQISFTAENIDSFILKCQERFSTERILEKADPAPRDEDNAIKETYRLFIEHLANKAHTLFWKVINQKVDSTMGALEKQHSQTTERFLPQFESEKQRVKVDVGISAVKSANCVSQIRR